MTDFPCGRLNFTHQWFIWFISLFYYFCCFSRTGIHTHAHIYSHTNKHKTKGKERWVSFLTGSWPVQTRGNMFIFSSLCRECVLGAEGTELWMISSVSAISVCLVFWLLSTSFALQAQTAPLEFLLLYTAGDRQKISNVTVIREEWLMIKRKCFLFVCLVVRVRTHTCIKNWNRTGTLPSCLFHSNLFLCFILHKRIYSYTLHTNYFLMLLFL